jgi:hypothetical protein
MTPEGKVKAAVTKVINAYGSDIYKFMPVPGGFGESSLDYILCVQGIFVAIETKKPGGKLTARQHFTVRSIHQAGGKVFVVDSGEAVTELIEFFNWVLQKTRTPEEIKAWPTLPR